MQQYHSFLTACGSTIPKSSAILKDLKPTLRFRRARSARVATIFNFDNNDLGGILLLDLVRVGGGKLAVSKITSYSEAADVEAGSSVKGNVSSSFSFIAIIQSRMITAGLLPAFPLLRVLLWVRRPPLSPVTDVLCISSFSGSLPLSLNLRIGVLHNGNVTIGDCKAVHAERGFFMRAVLEVQLDWLIEKEH